MVTDNSQTKRINIKLIGMISELQEQIQKKLQEVTPNKEVSFADASLELYHRVMNAGGLKKV